MGRINELKKELEGIPPLQFFAHIFSTPSLVQQMAKIRCSSAKYKPFISGAKRNLYIQYKNGCLEQQIEGFAAYVQVDPIELKKITLAAAENCIDQENTTCFRPFFDYLIDNCQKVKK